MLHFHDLDHMKIDGIFPFSRLCRDSMSGSFRTSNEDNLLTGRVESSGPRRPHLRQAVWQEPD